MKSVSILRKGTANFTMGFCSWRKLTIYILHIRSILELSCIVWHSSFTEKNKQDLERVKKSAVKIVLEKKYKDYENVVELVHLENLKERKETLI